MGKQTIIKIRERAKTVRLSNRINLLIVLGGLIAAGVAAFITMPDGAFGSADETPITEAPETLPWVAAKPLPASHAQSDRGAPSRPLRDPAVLKELTGKDVTLTDNPLDQLSLRRPSDEPPLPNPGTDQPYQPPVVDPPVFDPPIEDPPLEDPPQTDPTGLEVLSAEDRELYRQAKTHIDEGDRLWAERRNMKTQADADAMIKQADEQYKKAVEILLPLADRYPDVGALQTAITDAQRGRSSCSKHRTE
ncbi:MAG: hypothetical protein L6Q71_12045 [Planctomycetes bacterium]|nr:hypothetical protein [Planctomycetota bacterium]NUQ33689.1 hypothetical protein [Planctomycetaceae bacterium]